MAHWLEDITKLFTAKTHNLADLAKIVGYDPETFYEGTLSASEIRQRVLQTPIVAQETFLEEFSGNLGLAIVNVTADAASRSRNRLPAIVFENELSLQDAYFQGELNKDFVAVLRMSDYGQAKRESISLLIPVLEILEAEGFDVAILIDAIVVEAATTLTAAFNFDENASMGGRIGSIRDGDAIAFDWENSTLDVVLPAKELEKRQLEPFSKLSVDFHFDQRGLDGTRLPSAYQVIGQQEKNLAILTRKFSSARRSRGRLSKSYINIFHNVCRVLEKFLDAETLAPERGDFRAEIMFVELLDRLIEFSKRALSMRMYDAALMGIDVCLKVLGLSKDTELLVGGAHRRAMSLRLLGQIHTAREDNLAAIRAFRDAIGELRKHRYEGHSEYNQLFADIKRSLAKLEMSNGQLERAYQDLSEAEEVIRVEIDGSWVRADPTLTLIRIYEEKVQINKIWDRPDEALHQADEAVRFCEASLEYLEADRRNLECLARAYRLMADAQDLAGNSIGSLIALLSALSLEAIILSVVKRSPRRHERFRAQIRRLVRAAARLRDENIQDGNFTEAILTTFVGLNSSNDTVEAVQGLRQLEESFADLLPNSVNELRRELPLEEFISKVEQEAQEYGGAFDTGFADL